MKTTRYHHLFVSSCCYFCFYWYAVLVLTLYSTTTTTVQVVEATTTTNRWFKPSSLCSSTTPVAFIVTQTVVEKNSISQIRHSNSKAILRRRPSLSRCHPKAWTFDNRKLKSSSSMSSLSLLGCDDANPIATTNIRSLGNHKIRHRHQHPHHHQFHHQRTKHAAMFDSYRPYDNLFSGLAEISLGCSIGVLWSEISIALTGCGPSNLSDSLERICYQGLIVFAGVGLFNRVVSTATSFLINGGGESSPSSSDSSGPSSSIVNEFLSPSNSLTSLVEEQYGPLQSTTTIQIQAAEFLSVLAVFGSVLVLGVQYYVRGTTMDGLSGIDVDLCRAIQDL